MEHEDNITPVPLSMQEYLAALRRRRATILQTFALISVVGVVVTLVSKPVYQASARLLVDGPTLDLNAIDSKNPLSSLFALSQQQSVETQVEVLAAQPLTNAVQRQVGPASLTIKGVGSTNVIEVTAEASNPQTAADAPNLLLKMFIEQSRGQNLGDMNKALEFVQQQGKEAHKKLTDSEAALMAFQQKNHVVELTKNRDDQIARVAELTTEYQKEQADLAALTAQIADDRRLLSRVPATATATVQQTNPIVAGLEGDIRSLEVQRVGMMQRGGYGPDAPPVQAVDAQIADLRRRITQQPTLSTSKSISPNSVRAGLASKILDLQTQMAALQTHVALTARALSDAKARVGFFPALQVVQERLMQEHDDAAAADKMFSDQAADLILREKAYRATAHIIETAQPPREPVRPKKLQSIAFSCLIGLFLGFCLALLQEFLDDRINSVEDAGRLLGLAPLGHIPALSVTDAHLLPQMKGLDPASESYRVLRTNIHFASLDAPARTLLVTSANPGEGKSTTAANLAFAMALDGKRVILVDTDLRRPSLHKLLGLESLPGLTDALLGHAALLPREVMPGLSVVTAGTTPPNPGELLNTRSFRSLVEHLMTQADMVIFDSPPVLAAADASILASQMDGTVLVIEPGMTKKGAARRALQLLTSARANILGIAYNKMRSQDLGDYYYYQYQYATPAMLEAQNGHQEGQNGHKKTKTQLPVRADFSKPPLDFSPPAPEPVPAPADDSREGEKRE